MSFRPIVAVSSAIRRESDVRSSRLRTTYLTALENARLVPVVTAPLHDRTGAAALIDRVDALVLTGGADVDPALYGEPEHPALGDLSRERDDWELALVEAARSRNVPVLAICRGVQVLNVALGGTLYQDLPSQRPGAINHDPDLPRSSRTHPVEIAADCRIARALGVTHMHVNSVHHQSIARVADDLRIVATSPDGVIEAVETSPDSDWWCVGVQWHPEDLIGTAESWDRDLFDAFAAEVRSEHTARTVADGR